MTAAARRSNVVSFYEAKTHLSELSERAIAGEEILVTKHGKLSFRITALEPKKPRPLPGSVDLGANREQWTVMADVDWFTPDEEVERLFGTRE
jgi:antitoxin (DNA-binding transcriptional repressor) of toxin-antitoxin stability system